MKFEMKEAAEHKHSKKRQKAIEKAKKMHSIKH